MSLLKVKEQWGGRERESPNFFSFVALLHWVADQDLREAMLAANINSLRREAPYCYLFANDHFIETWRTDDNPHQKEELSFTNPYLQSFECRQLHRGVWLNGTGMWLTSPRDDFNTTTVVLALLQGDVLPIIYYLDSQAFSLLCLPIPISLAEIDEIVGNAATPQDCLSILLQDGGCYLTLVDHYVLSVRTFDAGFAKYFMTEPDQVIP